jgi:hypothetical protein
MVRENEAEVEWRKRRVLKLKLMRGKRNSEFEIQNSRNMI